MQQKKANGRLRQSVTNTWTSLLSKTLVMVCGFLLKTLFIHTLGIEYTGVSSLFTDILTVLSLAELGISMAITYALYEPLAKQDTVRIKQLMKFYQKAYRIIAGIVLAVGLALLPFLDILVTDVPDIKENIRLIFVMFVVNSSLSYLLVYKSTLLIADQKISIVSTIDGIIAVVKLIIDAVVLIVFKEYMVYLVVTLFFTLLRNIIVSSQANRHYPFLLEKGNEKLPKNERKSIMSDIKALSIYKISEVVLKSTDSIIISSFLGTSLVGIVSIYRYIVSSIRSMVLQIYYAIKPSLGNAAVENPDGQWNNYQTLFFFSFWITCFCTVSLSVLLDPFVTWWFSGKYPLSDWVIIVMCADFFFDVMNLTSSAFRNINGLFIQGRYRPLVMVILNIVISLLLVRPLGVLGVLLGTILSRVLTQTWYDPYLIYKHVLKRSVFHYYKKLLQYFCITVLCYILVQGISLIIPVNSAVLLLFISAVMCLIIPNAVIFLLYRNTAEFHRLVSMVRSVINQKIKGKRKQ